MLTTYFILKRLTSEFSLRIFLKISGKYQSLFTTVRILSNWYLCVQKPLIRNFISFKIEFQSILWPSSSFFSHLTTYFHSELGNQDSVAY